MGNACVSAASGTSTRLTSPTVKQKPLLLVILGFGEGVTGWSRQLAVITLVPGAVGPPPSALIPTFHRRTPPHPWLTEAAQPPMHTLSTSDHLSEGF